ncbi:MAG: N-acetylmuramoyl-L-alanine amidase family protein [Desulfobacca sp.]|uniref:N-acetylmuramoyl-L-alanine amidase family protein n=1 Tax=Desulfobacca sp. TaxID=2067990 RepID=UPI0040499A5F
MQIWRKNHQGSDARDGQTLGRGQRPGLTAVLLLLLWLLGGGVTTAWSLQECRVAIDIGHSWRDPGAISARGVPEYRFNRHMARLLLSRLHQDPIFRGSFLVNETGEAVPLASRPAMAAARRADVFLSIHHDSVYPEQLSQWVYQGRRLDVCDRFSGHSIFISAKNGKPQASLQLAKGIGQAMRQAGLRPTLHHAGRGNKVLLDRELGIYAFDNLAVLKNADMPAVLFECGVIKNSQEEVKLCDPSHQQRLVEALYTALKEYWRGSRQAF